MDEVMQSAASSTLSSLAEILIVEDEENPRRELSRALTRKGFKVRQAGSNVEAVKQFKRGNVGAILMDVVLKEEPDGIQTAHEIQQDSPEIPVFFVTAYSEDPIYRRRAEACVPNIAGWVPKPIPIPELVLQLTSELQKGQAVQSAQVLRRKEKKLAVGSPEPTMESIAVEVDAVYKEMRALIVSSASKPGLRDALAPLRERLRSLQAQESKLIAKHYDAHFSPLYKQGQDLIRRARKLLEDE